MEQVRPDGSAVIGVRNRIRCGDELEFIGPGMRSQRLRIDRLQLLDDAGNCCDVAAVNPNQRIFLPLPFTAEPYDLIRRDKGSVA